jgi:hypothetical protein
MEKMITNDRLQSASFTKEADPHASYSLIVVLLHVQH